MSDTVLRDAMECNPGTGCNYDDIARVLASWYVPPEGYDGRSGVWLVEWKDGTRSALYGWHDTTGWDCRSGLALHPFETWRTVVKREYAWSASCDEVISSLETQLAVRKHER